MIYKADVGYLDVPRVMNTEGTNVYAHTEKRSCNIEVSVTLQAITLNYGVFPYIICMRMETLCSHE